MSITVPGLGSTADPRVSRCRDGYTVAPTPGGASYRVAPHDVLGWAIHRLDTGELYQAPGGGYALGYQTAQQAIAALLTHPGTAPRSGRDHAA